MCYLGGFIGYDESKQYFLLYRTLQWEKNISGGEIYSGKLRHGGTRDPIRMDFSTCDKKQGTYIRMSGEASSGKLFVSPLLHKI